MGWIRDWRRRRLLRKYRLPETLWQSALDWLPPLGHLSESEHNRLRDLVTVFLHERSLEGMEGLELTDDMRVAIGVQACLPILHLGLDWYDGWRTVLVYPDAFVAEHETVDAAGVVGTESRVLSGEAWDLGPTVLSWADIAASRDAGDGNPVMHECAHKIDLRSGDVNGAPPLPRDLSPSTWARVWTAAYEDLCRRVDRNEITSIDPYGAEDPAEFFAVATESFFMQPLVLRAAYGDIYDCLSHFYRQDPAAGAAQSRG